MEIDFGEKSQNNYGRCLAMSVASIYFSEANVIQETRIQIFVTENESKRILRAVQC